MVKMVPSVLTKEDEEDSEEAGADDLGDKFSVERVQSIGLRALQERLKEKLGKSNRKRNAGEVTGVKDGNPSKKKQKRMEKAKKKNGHQNKNKSSAKKGIATIGTNSNDVQVPQRPSFVDDSGRVVFSKFDFTSSAHKEVQLAERKSMSNKKDYKKLLAKAEAAQRKLEELKKTDEKRGEELAKKLMWQKAMDMARGTKIKDNPKLLKKTVKKIEKRKKKTSKEWEERKNMEREAMEKRQAKRKAHVEERKEQIRSKKIKKRMKKGKGRTPGF